MLAHVLVFFLSTAGLIGWLPKYAKPNWQAMILAIV